MLFTKSINFGKPATTQPAGAGASGHATGLFGDADADFDAGGWTTPTVAAAAAAGVHFDSDDVAFHLTGGGGAAVDNDDADVVDAAAAGNDADAEADAFKWSDSCVQDVIGAVVAARASPSSSRTNGVHGIRFFFIFLPTNDWPFFFFFFCNPFFGIFFQVIIFFIPSSS